MLQCAGKHAKVVWMCVWQAGHSVPARREVRRSDSIVTALESHAEGPGKSQLEAQAVSETVSTANHSARLLERASERRASPDSVAALDAELAASMCAPPLDVDRPAPQSPP